MCEIVLCVAVHMVPRVCCCTRVFEVCTHAPGWLVGCWQGLVPCWDQPCPGSLLEGTSCGMYAHIHTHRHTYTHTYAEQLLLLQLLLSPIPELPVPKGGEKGGEEESMEKKKKGGVGQRERKRNARNERRGERADNINWKDMRKM